MKIHGRERDATYVPCHAGPTAAAALEACLAACAEFGQPGVKFVDEVLGAAYQAIHNVCHAQDFGDRRAGARKQRAAELGALETIAHGMQKCRQRWVQQAGKTAIGCICKGVDKGAAARRQRAHALFKLMR